jgi:hypothetical protein
MLKRLYTLIFIAAAAMTMSFAPSEVTEKGTDLKATKFSKMYHVADTYIEVTLNDGHQIPLMVSGKHLRTDEVIVLIESFTSEEFEMMVEAPSCDVGLVVEEDYIGTNFVKLTCAIPHCCGPAQTTECKTYNPYTHRWQATSCSPWNYE